MVDEKERYIIGTMLDLHNVYEGGYGKTYLSNINGEKDIDVIKSISGLGTLTARAKRLT